MAFDAVAAKAFQASSDLSLWFKVRGGDDLTLADIPQIIPLRWAYFRDNWEFIKSDIVNNASLADDPDFLLSQVQSFSNFIDKQRNAASNINPFSDSIIYNTFYAVFDNVLIENVNLTNEEQTLINNSLAKVQAYSKNDFLRIKTDIRNYRDKLADVSGLSDDDYNRAYGRSSAPAQKDPLLVDLSLMGTLQDDLDAVNFVLANLFAVDSAADPFAVARSNANNPDIDIGQYVSGRLVKMEYGEDLSALAYRTMGDSNRWIDIAIANGLKPPYIDEVGVAISLLSNGSGNQINLAATDINGVENINKLYVNQVIFIQSNAQPFPDQRTILNIIQVPVSGEIILELDGDGNLDQYHTADQASIRVFAPNTVNSKFFILIPSEAPLANPRQDEVPWFLAKSAADEKLAKVDIAIGENGEINFSTNGDLSLSYGLSNAIQAIRLKMMTELGSLRYHPTYGLVNVIGSKNNNIADLRSALTQSISQQIAADARFDRIESLKVEYGRPPNGGNNSVGAISITLSVRLSGGSTVIPISFTITK